LPFLSRFKADAAGNTAMIFALCLPVLLAVVGGAIDFSRVTQLRMELQDAADTAALGAIAVNSAGYKAGSNLAGDGAISDGVDQALSILNTNIGTHAELSAVAPAATVTKTGNALTANVTVSANYKPYLLGLIGFSTIPLNVTSVSTAGLPPYINFYLLLDNTPSMGVGATTADIDKMVANTPDKCAFACHQMDKVGKDYYAKAKALGVTTRIDVVRQATQNLMTTAKASQTAPGQYGMAIYHFGMAADAIDQKKPQPYLISSLTTNLDASAANAAAIDLMTIPYQNYNSDRQTNFKSMLQGMNTIIPSAGDGTSPQKPQQVLFLVSDGTNDGYDCAYSNGGTCRRITPIDPQECHTIKARGVRIAVLYTTYLPLPTNAFYNQHLAKYQSQLATEMEACASPGLFFEVSPSEGISDAMSALFTRVVSVVRIKS
jgi:Flp pilus assembly protein TadG